MARPAGLEPATLGLEGPVSDRLSIDDYHPRRLDGLDLANSRRFLPRFAVSIASHAITDRRDDHVNVADRTRSRP